MDAANLTEKYILWSNILDLRSREINIARTARRLGVSRNTVRHLKSLSLKEVLQHKERHYKLHAYEMCIRDSIYLDDLEAGEHSITVKIPQGAPCLLYKSVILLRPYVGQ